MKQITALLIIFMLTARLLSAQDMLEEYLHTAAVNNPGLKAKFNEYLAALEQIPQAGSIPDPQLAFGYFIQPVETRNGPQRLAVSFSQMLPWFGTTGAKKDAAMSMAKAKYEAFEAEKSKLYFDVKASYYDLYFISKGIDIAYENIKILESFRSMALIRMEAGKSSGLDEIRVAMELAELENNLAMLKDNWNYHSVRFNKLLNVASETEIKVAASLPENDLPYSRQAILDSLNMNNPEVKRLDFMAEAYRDREEIAKKSGAPNITLGIDYFVIGKSENPMAAVDNGRDGILFPKVGISIPLYRKKYSSMVNEALYMQEAVENQKEDKVNMLEVLMQQAINNYQDAQRRIKLYADQRELATKAMNILESEYSSNGSSFEELLRMERKLLHYGLELQRGYADKQAAIAFIYYLMGK
ncbi:MAG TPA: TolC family protein [Bacteroidales bacterium]|nr:TolC family protein [Bacteroidales bacterium]